MGNELFQQLFLSTDRKSVINNIIYSTNAFFFMICDKEVSILLIKIKYHFSKILSLNSFIIIANKNNLRKR